MIKQGEQEKQVVLWGYLTRESLSTQRLFNVASVAIVAISNSQLVIDIGIGNIFTLATFSKFHSTTTTTTAAINCGPPALRLCASALNKKPTRNSN